MFINIVRKILATVLAIFEIWLSIIYGFIYGEITDNTLIGISIVMLGIFLSYTLSFCLYGFYDEPTNNK